MSGGILKEGIEEFVLTYSDKQAEIFFDCESEYRIVPKGRRTGYTHSCAHYLEDICFDPSLLDYKFPGVEELNILWVDTVQTNIDRYVERYFLPPLKKQVKSEFFKWRQQKKELKILNSTIDFRSSDRPENIEGFGYHVIVLNEAGIILKGEKGRYLWENALMPMLMDFSGLVLIGGTPKGATDKNTGKDTLYKTLIDRGNSDFEIDKNYQSFRLIPEDSPFLTQEKVKELRIEFTGNLAKQELDGLCVDIGSGEIFKREWFEFIEEDELPERFEDIFSSWDTAFGDGEENDDSAQITFGITPKNIFILDSWKGKVNFPDLKRKFDDVANKPGRLRAWRAIIEGKASGDPLLDEIDENTHYPVDRIIPIGDKVSRANSVTPYFKNGKVKVLNTEENRIMVNDACNFPEAGRDLTDCLSQGVKEVRDSGHINTSENVILTKSVSRISSLGDY